MNRIIKIPRIVPVQWKEATRPEEVVVRQIRSAIEGGLPRDRSSRRHHLHLALNEAEALAWQSGYPALLFPLLAEEKIAAVQHWEERQQNLWEEGIEMAFAA
jgi:hypothetical protein